MNTRAITQNKKVVTFGEVMLRLTAPEECSCHSSRLVLFLLLHHLCHEILVSVKPPRG